MNIRLQHGSDGQEPIQEFAVYLNDSHDKRTLMLLFPHKGLTQAQSQTYVQTPLRLRIKPSSGLVEVDLAIRTDVRYNQTQGAKFSQALKQSRTKQSGGDLGLAGGFGTNPAARTREIKQDVGDGAAESSSDFDQITYMTLGGRVQISTEHDAPYMVGVFKEGELHLTQVDAVCSLRPQFHHLDAMTDNERATSRAGAGDHPPHESEARAVNMAVKSTDDEELDMGEVGKTLRNIQEETWQHLEWVDENDENAFATFDNNLHLRSEETKSQTLFSSLTEKQYREVASAPRIEPMKQGKRVLSTHPWSSDDEDTVEEEEEEEDEEVIAVKTAPQATRKARKAKTVKPKTESG